MTFADKLVTLAEGAVDDAIAEVSRQAALDLQLIREGKWAAGAGLMRLRRFAEETPTVEQLHVLLNNATKLAEQEGEAKKEALRREALAQERATALDEAIHKMMMYLRLGDAKLAWDAGCDALGWARELTADEVQAHKDRLGR